VPDRAPTDVAVVGGGVAGAAAALRLARAGARVVVLERERGPRPKVCGEFLSGLALAELAALGLPATCLGAVPLTRTRFSARSRSAETRLSFPAASLTRERLDEALLLAAAEAGALVRRGVTVRAVTREGTGWRIDHSDGEVRAPRVLAASGKADLPGGRRAGAIHGTLVGLKRYVTLSPAAGAALGDRVDVALFPGGYCGIQRTEDGRANVCLVVERSFLKAHRGRTDAAFEAVRRQAATAGDLLANARPSGGRPLAVGHVPYGFVRACTEGPYHLGDQAAVIPSFCGEGMAIALSSARLAADAILADEEAAPFQRRLARLAGPRVRLSAILSRILCTGRAQAALAAAAPVVPPLLDRLAALTRISVEAPGDLRTVRRP